MTVTKHETKLPFPGFYHSIYDHEIDFHIERDCEYFAEEWGVDIERVRDTAFSHIDCSDAHKAIAELHCYTWLEMFSDETGIDLYSGFKFYGMTSPKYYNFETDRVFVQIPLPGLQQCFDACKRDGFKTLAATIEERFTSRDGFMSFYSNDLNAWLLKPLAEWDCNEMEALLIAMLALTCDAQEFCSDVDMTVVEQASGNGLCGVVNWDKVEVELMERASA